MTGTIPQPIQELLDPQEHVIWQGDVFPKRSHNIIQATAILIAMASVWLGWSSSSPFAIWAPALAKFSCTLIALLLGAFAALIALDRHNTLSATLTDQRILSLNKFGGVPPKSGFNYDFTSECNVIARGALRDLDIPTLKEESGYPDYFSLGKLEPDVADALVSAFNDLKIRQNDSKTRI